MNRARSWLSPSGLFSSRRTCGPAAHVNLRVRRSFRPRVTGLEERRLLTGYSVTDLINTSAVGGVAIDPQGNIYFQGESTPGFGEGVFQIAKGTDNITPLASFNATNLSDPAGSPVLDAQGNLYGVTGGGADNFGAVYEIVKGSGTVTTIASFDGSNGANPTAGLTIDSQGNLYGTTYGPGPGNTLPDGEDGSVFEIAKGSGTITTLFGFYYTRGLAPDGVCPYGGVTLDSQGDIYGTTTDGGPLNNGTVFEINAETHAFTTLASFNSQDGDVTRDTLTLDASGNLYGTTASGGVHNDGTVFEIATGTNTITALASFDGADGSMPFGGVALDGQGNLFGTTEDGGTVANPPVGFGTIYEIAHGSNAITDLAEFGNGDYNGANGAFPVSTLVPDGEGNFYGTAGGVFELSPQPWNTTVLASFSTTGSSGFGPTGGLVMDDQGNLYGTTGDGGAYYPSPFYPYGDYGAVYEIASGSNTITTIASFDGTDGQNPAGGLVLDSQGNLYGTTQYGGANGAGTIFEIVKGSDFITDLASFDGDGVTTGAVPEGGLVLDSEGNLYGTTPSGGAGGGYGTVFELAKGSNTITTLASFNGADGTLPYDTLVLDSQGDIYGTTYSGGLYKDRDPQRIEHDHRHRLVQLCRWDEPLRWGRAGRAREPIRYNKVWRRLQQQCRTWRGYGFRDRQGLEHNHRFGPIQWQ
jgi:uncharacterized repeat protein (TIGR03803 family)